ncbi:MAG: carbohydrate ABC transporter permease [Phycisphaerae bacterium]
MEPRGEKLGQTVLAEDNAASLPPPHGDGTRRPDRVSPINTARVVIYGLLIGVSALWLLPLLWMASVSLKPASEVSNTDLLPHEPTLTSYKRLLTHDESGASVDATGRPVEPTPFYYPLLARNTLIIALLSLVGMLASSSIAAYGFARIEFPGRNILFAICLATMMIPFPVLMVPQYMLFRALGWIGTFAPLWVPAWFGTAFNIFLLRQFFMGLPKELEEAAAIDGCSRFGVFWRIMLPLARPALVVVALLHIMFVWNDLVGPLIYLSHPDEFTLALGLQFLQARSGDTPWNELMAASTLIVLPVVILFVFAQRVFIRGVATTGMK